MTDRIETTEPEAAAGVAGQSGVSCSVSRLKVLDLFSGIGGFSLGLERAGMKTVAFCEIETFPRKVLQKHWPDVPIFEDVRELHAEDLPCKPDVITGGYPCQPFSVAGKRRGKEDDRHLWPEIIRIIRELGSSGKKPDWCLFENVAGHISMGLDQVLTDLEGEAYTCWAFIIPACSLNAPHRRDRVWIVANASGERSGRKGRTAGNKKRGTSQGRRKSLRQAYRAALPGWINATGEDVANAYGAGLQTQRAEQQTTGLEQHGKLGQVLADPCSTGREECNIAAKPSDKGHAAGGSNEEVAANTKGKQAGRILRPRIQTDFKSGCDRTEETKEWATEPPVCGPDDGVPNRVARLKALGNAVVPQIPEIIGRAILAQTGTGTEQY